MTGHSFLWVCERCGWSPGPGDGEEHDCVIEGEVLALDKTRRTNARLMLDCRTLGYLSDDRPILDATYNVGRFWKLWRPALLMTNDLAPHFETDYHFDITGEVPPPLEPLMFSEVVFDPPYKLNGTPSKGGPATSDESYGVGKWLSARERMSLIRNGAIGAGRLASSRLLVKLQSQVNAGRMWWQDDLVIGALGAHEPDPDDPDPPPREWRLEDRVEVYGYRAQPPGRSQQHARSVSSSLLVFRRIADPPAERLVFEAPLVEPPGLALREEYRR